VSDDPTADATKAVVEVVSKALDLAAPGLKPVAREAGGIIANALGYYIGDKLTHVRIRNLARLEDETRGILGGRGVGIMREVSAAIGTPLLEAAEDEHRDELVSMWARLLANAMDPTKPDRLRLEYIDAVKRMHPQDALMLSMFKNMEAIGHNDARKFFTERLHIS